MFYAKFQTWMFHECLNSACVPHLHLFIQYLLYRVSILNNDTFMFVCLGLCICVLVFVHPMTFSLYQVLFCIEFCFVSVFNFEQWHNSHSCLCVLACVFVFATFLSNVTMVLYLVLFCIEFQFWTATEFTFMFVCLGLCICVCNFFI